MTNTRIFKKKNYSYSLADNMKRFIWIAVFVISINIIISIVSIINIRQQSYETIESSITIFQQETSSHLNAIQHFLEWTIVKEMLIESLENTTNDYQQHAFLDSLQIRFANHQYTTGNKFNYFLYFQQQNQFLNVSKFTFSYDDYLGIKDFIINYSSSDKRHLLSWQFTEVNSKVYMYCIVKYGNRTLATFINIDDLFMSLLDMNFVEQGKLVIADNNGNIVFSTSETKTITDFSFYHTQHSFYGNDEQLPYNILLTTNDFHNYGNLFFFHWIVIITSTIICLILSSLIFSMYKKAIKPIQEFSTNLSSINEDSNLLDLQSNQIRELEQTNIQFKNLIHEIKKLKITVYENELEKKRSDITFLQHQIKPHFYLNCLTTISSMAQLEDYDNIESMILFTSRYLRYLFQTDKDYLCVKYELAHIDAFLDIQQLRLGAFFTYTCSIDEKDKNALIPPLLLITFIENTLKHNTSSDGNLHVRLIITQQKQDNDLYLNIDISDSGHGFPIDVLERLSLGESINRGDIPHVGIENSIQRLNLLYGEKHKIRFFNGEHSGAHIQIIIPYQI
ncbi:sensor histidine kinase [Anaerosporobacter sp.]|uniref:sensor histidine kinase n=1 Tax=Anaerosporobacter sp. TaxID=1872529 RepID=UPI00286F729D|nr:histidine kinase [Anaerosporobacter sp.]